MRPEDPRGPSIARVVLIFGALASAPVLQGWTAAELGSTSSIGRPESLANRGAFSRFEAA